MKVLFRFFIIYNGGNMKEEYEKFIVYQLDDNYSFVHIEIKDDEQIKVPSSEETTQTKEIKAVEENADTTAKLDVGGTR